MTNDVKCARLFAGRYTTAAFEKIGSNAVLRPKIPMPRESKNPVTHDHDRQLMNVQTSEDLDARRAMPRRRVPQRWWEKDAECCRVPRSSFAN